jgi:hypothetical protein
MRVCNTCLPAACNMLIPFKIEENIDFFTS